MSSGSCVCVRSEVLHLPVADGLVHELGRDRRVDTARDGTNNLALVSADLADAKDLLLDESVL